MHLGAKQANGYDCGAFTAHNIEFGANAESFNTGAGDHENPKANLLRLRELYKPYAEILLGGKARQRVQAVVLSDTSFLDQSRLPICPTPEETETALSAITAAIAAPDGEFTATHTLTNEQVRCLADEEFINEDVLNAFVARVVPNPVISRSLVLNTFFCESVVKFMAGHIDYPALQRLIRKARTDGLSFPCRIIVPVNVSRTHWYTLIFDSTIRRMILLDSCPVEPAQMHTVVNIMRTMQLLHRSLGPSADIALGNLKWLPDFDADDAKHPAAVAAACCNTETVLTLLSSIKTIQPNDLPAFEAVTTATRTELTSNGLSELLEQASNFAKMEPVVKEVSRIMRRLAVAELGQDESVRLTCAHLNACRDAGVAAETQVDAADRAPTPEPKASLRTPGLDAVNVEVHFQNYTGAMSQEGTWGGEPELAVLPAVMAEASATTEGPMFVYKHPECNEEMPCEMSPQMYGKALGGDPSFVLHTRSNSRRSAHYVALIPVECTEEALAAFSLVHVHPAKFAFQYGPRVQQFWAFGMPGDGNCLFSACALLRLSRDPAFHEGGTNHPGLIYRPHPCFGPDVTARLADATKTWNQVARFAQEICDGSPAPGTANGAEASCFDESTMGSIVRLNVVREQFGVGLAEEGAVLCDPVLGLGTTLFLTHLLCTTKASPVCIGMERNASTHNLCLEVHDRLANRDDWLGKVATLCIDSARIVSFQGVTNVDCYDGPSLSETSSFRDSNHAQLFARIFCSNSVNEISSTKCDPKTLARYAEGQPNFEAAIKSFFCIKIGNIHGRANKFFRFMYVRRRRCQSASSVPDPHIRQLIDAAKGAGSRKRFEIACPPTVKPDQVEMCDLQLPLASEMIAAGGSKGPFRMMYNHLALKDTRTGQNWLLGSSVTLQLLSAHAAVIFALVLDLPTDSPLLAVHYEDTGVTELIDPNAHARPLCFFPGTSEIRSQLSKFNVKWTAQLKQKRATTFQVPQRRVTRSQCKTPPSNLDSHESSSAATVQTQPRVAEESIASSASEDSDDSSSSVPPTSPGLRNKSKRLLDAKKQRELIECSRKERELNEKLRSKKDQIREREKTLTRMQNEFKNKGKRISRMELKRAADADSSSSDSNSSSSTNSAADTSALVAEALAKYFRENPPTQAGSADTSALVTKALAKFSRENPIKATLEQIKGASGDRDKAAKDLKKLHNAYTLKIQEDTAARDAEMKSVVREARDMQKSTENQIRSTTQELSSNLLAVIAENQVATHAKQAELMQNLQKELRDEKLSSIEKKLEKLVDNAADADKRRFSSVPAMDSSFTTPSPGSRRSSTYESSPDDKLLYDYVKKKYCSHTHTRTHTHTRSE